jgi:eukaryotic-like serine/threonine-protein kinase
MVEAKVLANRYRLLSKLGQGGMGSVWLAEHLALRTQVAVKFIDVQIAASPDALGRFEREAQSAAELRSTHIVQILDYGIDEGTPFIAMELLRGESLATRLNRLRVLNASDVAHILSQVAKALGLAHDKGVIHRDLKPDNIFLVREGDDEVTKVLDFGIAKKLDALSLDGGVKTNTGALLGTPYYMSPEQALGRSSIDHRTDVWSLGIIAYECMVGARPFERDTLGALLMAICSESLPVPSLSASVPLGFDEWFAHVTARDPQARFQSAIEAAHQLRALCELTNAASPKRSNLPDVPPVAHQEPAKLSVTAAPSSVTIPGLARRRQWARWQVALPVLGFAAATSYFVWAWVTRAPSSVTPTLARPATSLISGAEAAASPSLAAEKPTEPIVTPNVGVSSASSAPTAALRDRHNLPIRVSKPMDTPSAKKAPIQSSDDFVGF